MPGMDGFETAENIKRLDQTKDVPVILITGTDVDTDYAYRGYALGVADFLAKPIDPWVLRTKVNVFLELHRVNRQLSRQAEQLKQLLIADQTPASGPSPRVGDSAPEQLADITVRLVQLESLLREGEHPADADLADRIADLERLVRSLALPPRATGT
jgi:response regulator RpfG family c-di-GMP phosphodiesterase